MDQDTNGTGYRVDGDSVWMGSTNPENISQKFKNEMTGVTTMCFNLQGVL